MSIYTTSASTAMTATQIKQMNQMNAVSRSVQLGTRIANMQKTDQASGSYAAVAADASASLVALLTGTTTINGYLVQANRSGSPLLYLKTVAVGGSAIAVTSGSSSYAIAANDTFFWLSW